MNFIKGSTTFSGDTTFKILYLGHLYRGCYYNSSTYCSVSLYHVPFSGYTTFWCLVLWRFTRGMLAYVVDWLVRLTIPRGGSHSSGRSPQDASAGKSRSKTPMLSKTRRAQGPTETSRSPPPQRCAWWLATIRCRAWKRSLLEPAGFWSFWRIQVTRGSAGCRPCFTHKRHGAATTSICVQMLTGPCDQRLQTRVGYVSVQHPREGRGERGSLLGQ